MGLAFRVAGAGPGFALGSFLALSFMASPPSHHEASGRKGMEHRKVAMEVLAGHLAIRKEGGIPGCGP